MKSTATKYVRWFVYRRRSADFTQTKLCILEPETELTDFFFKDRAD